MRFADDRSPVPVSVVCTWLGTTRAEISGLLRDRARSYLRGDTLTAWQVDTVGRELASYRDEVEKRRLAEEIRDQSLITTAEAAEAFDVTIATIRKWVSRGYLRPVTQRGRSNVFRYGEVRRAKARRRQREKPKATLLAPVSQTARYVTVKWAAEQLEVSRSTLRMWVHRGLLKPAGRKGNRLVFDVNEINAFIIERQRR